MWLTNAVLFLCILQLACVHSANSNICLNTTQSALIPPKQIVFVHIYKTGGSTMREIFREYGEKCSYSVAVIVRCDHDATLDASKVTDKTVLPCQMKNFQANDNRLTVKPSVGMVRKRSTLAFTRQFDVIVGHLPHGLFKFVSELKGEPGALSSQVAVRAPRERLLVTWLRHPLSMIISSCLYLINKNQGAKTLVKTSYQDVLEKIRVKMDREENIISSSGAYSQFIKYLLPGGLVAAAKMTEEAIVAFIGSHLKEYAVIGILERHKTSLQMLKRTIDPTVSLSEDWWTAISSMKRNAVPAVKASARRTTATKGTNGGGASQGEESASRRLAATDGTLSTDAIRSYIESNSTLTAHIEHVLRLEYKIYEMALAEHHVQCAKLAAQYPDIKCDE
jgi:hypothetical protein